jgi:hypothetical protein
MLARGGSRRSLLVGTLANKTVRRPSAIVGCVRIASRSPVKGSPASIAVCTTATTSPAGRGAASQAVLGGVAKEVRDLGAADHVLAWHAGDIGTRATYQGALDHGRSSAGPGQLPSDVFSGFAAAQDEDLVALDGGHHAHPRLDIATVAVGIAPSRVPRTRPIMPSPSVHAGRAHEVYQLLSFSGAMTSGSAGSIPESNVDPRLISFSSFLSLVSEVLRHRGAGPHGVRRGLARLSPPWLCLLGPLARSRERPDEDLSLGS